MPKQTLTLSEFEATLPYLKMEEQNKLMAKDYLVVGLPLSTVSANYGCTKQNVLNTSTRFLKAFKKYQDALERMQS